MNDTENNVISLRAATQDENEVEFSPATQSEINALQEAANPFFYTAHHLAEQGTPGSLINAAALFVTAQLLARDTSPEFAAEQLINMASKVLNEFPNNSADHA